MKKLALLSLLMAITTPVLMAITTPVLAADTIPPGVAPNIDLDIRVLDGKTSIFSTRTAITEGEPYQTQALKETSYLARAEPTPGGVAMTPGVVTSGTIFTVTSSQVKDGRVTLDLNVSNTELLAIDTVRQNGVDLQLPRTRHFTIKRAVELQDGQLTDIPFQVESGAVYAGQPAPTPRILRLVASTRVQSILPATR